MWKFRYRLSRCHHQACFPRMACALWWVPLFTMRKQSGGLTCFGRCRSFCGRLLLMRMSFVRATLAWQPGRRPSWKLDVAHPLPVIACGRQHEAHPTSSLILRHVLWTTWAPAFRARTCANRCVVASATHIAQFAKHMSRNVVSYDTLYC